MSRGGSSFGNKYVARGLSSSGVIAIFAGLSTPPPGVAIILRFEMLAIRRDTLEDGSVHWFKRLIAVAVLSMSTALLGVGASYGQDKVVRIGFQKYGKLVLLKSKATLEDKLKAAGYKVVWTEFPSGPPLLEALNVGVIDFGNAGEAPPIFAQAAGAPIQYVAYEPPAPQGEAILVPKDSKLNSVADLRGKKVALNKGSNVHYLLVKALEKAGVKYSEIQPVFLAPADARAAFERGAVDAWAIWDPFLAAAEAATDARTLSDGTGTVSNYQFYFSSRKFLEGNSSIVDLVLAELSSVDDWAKSDIHAVAEQLAPAVGLPVPVVEVALRRQAYGIKPVTESVIADQQRVADTFFALGLLPKPIRISDAARRPGT
jgi:sulfonate transport system substrate-binding protein